MPDDESVNSCQSLSEPVSSIVDEVYTQGAHIAAVEFGPAAMIADHTFGVGDIVGDFAGGFVHDHWDQVCEVADTASSGISNLISEAVSNIESTVGDWFSNDKPVESAD